MNRVHATSIGYAARELLAGNEAIVGHVHSLFRRAVNIQTTAGRLISFSTAQTPNFPANVVTTLESTIGFLDGGISLGLPVRSGSTVGIGHLDIYIESAQVHKPLLWGSLPMPRLSELEPALTKAATAVWCSEPRGLSPLLPYLAPSFPYRDTKPSFTDPFCAAAWEHVTRLLSLPNPSCVSHAAKPLIGLGPGLTPSGDDLLAGMMVACHFGYKALQRDNAALVQHFSPILARAALGTNPLSQEMLHFAARGELTDVAEKVIMSFIGTEGLNPLKCISELLTYGASSGVDQLVGILLGLRMSFAI